MFSRTLRNVRWLQKVAYSKGNTARYNSVMCETKKKILLLNAAHRCVFVR